MKKLSYLFAALLFGGLIFSGCSKDEEKPTPEPTPTETTIVYLISNVWEGIDGVVYTLSPCFHINFTYTDADGKQVEVNDATLPWEKSITVTSPFEAKLEGNFTYNEDELPEEVEFCKNIKINLPNAEEHEGTKNTKQKFIELVETHPEKLSFSVSGKL